jgi:hypothetical protein
MLFGNFDGRMPKESRQTSLVGVPAITNLTAKVSLSLFGRQSLTPHSLPILFLLSHTSTAIQSKVSSSARGNLQKEMSILDLEVDNLKQLRKKTEHHIPVKPLPEEDRSPTHDRLLRRI